MTNNREKIKRELQTLSPFLEGLLMMEHLFRTEDTHAEEYEEAKRLWWRVDRFIAIAFEPVIGKMAKVASATVGECQRAVYEIQQHVLKCSERDARIVQTGTKFHALARSMLLLERMQPRFRVGDKIFDKKGNTFLHVIRVEHTGYVSYYPGIAYKPVFRAVFDNGFSLVEEANEPTPGYEMIFRD
jgi:hypothetical protein